MIRKDLEMAGIPFTTQDGDADFHAAGRHTYITGLLRNGTSLVVARQLARHSDVKMTMRYTHIGLEDQAKGIRNLPTDPSWLKTRCPTAPASQHISSSLQHICSKSCVCEGQAGTPAGSDGHSTGKKKDDASTDEASPCGMQRQKKAPPVTDGALVEAATRTRNGYHLTWAIRSVCAPDCDEFRDREPSKVDARCLQPAS